MAFPDAFSGTKVSQIKPSNNHLAKEQRRHRTVRWEVSVRVNSQARATVLFNWLVQNFITNSTDVTFIRQAIGDLPTLAAARERARTESARLQRSEFAPYVRLCHVVTDVEPNKEALIFGFQCLNREELDRRHNPEVARPNTRALIATTWNSREFDPRAATYPDTHRELGRKMNISYAATVALMGELGAQNAKDKWQEIKTQSILIVVESSVFGIGDGQRAAGQCGFPSQMTIQLD